MLSFRTAAALAVAALLVGCGGSPQQSIEKDCNRLNLFSELNENADSKKACACLAGKMKDSMSEKDLGKFAKVLSEAKTTDDFENLMTKHEVNEMTAMAFVGAAKSCAF